MGRQIPGSQSQLGHCRYLDGDRNVTSRPEPRFSHYRPGLTSRTSQGYLEDHAKGESVSEPRGPAGAWRRGYSYSPRPIPTAETPGEFCICSVNCSQDRGHRPGWCEPKSTVKDS